MESYPDEEKLVLVLKEVTVCPNLDGALWRFPVRSVLAAIQPGPLGLAPPLSSFIYPFNKTSLSCLAGKDMSLPAGNSLEQLTVTLLKGCTTLCGSLKVGGSVNSSQKRNT